MKYLIIDTNNAVMRIAKAQKQLNATDAIGLALHSTICMIQNVFETYEIDHVVWVTEGKSWRYSFDKTYKINRKMKKLQRTEEEIEHDNIITDTINEFIEYLENSTNCTVLKANGMEGDDFIARWIQRHPTDMHYIYSADTDFIQLVKSNVTLIDAKENRYYDDSFVVKDLKTGEALINKKTGKIQEFDPDYALFLKIIRGDNSDSVPSAFPRVRETKILKAFADIHDKGVEWNNFMSNKWTHPVLGEVTVRERYEHNKKLIDLTQQPEEIIQKMDEYIDNYPKKDIRMVGAKFMAFTAKHELVTLSKQAHRYAILFSKRNEQ